MVFRSLSRRSSGTANPNRDATLAEDLHLFDRIDPQIRFQVQVVGQHVRV